MDQEPASKIPTVKEIEDALKEMCAEYPRLDPGLSLFYTNMWTKEGEPLFLVNLGCIDHPAYIGGTKAQLEKRIEMFYKELKKSIDNMNNLDNKNEE